MIHPGQAKGLALDWSLDTLPARLRPTLIRRTLRRLEVWDTRIMFSTVLLPVLLLRFLRHREVSRLEVPVRRALVFCGVSAPEEAILSAGRQSEAAPRRIC